MKKLIYIIIAALTIGLAGCDNDFYSGIDGSADDKVTKLMDEWQKDLMASEYGWFADIMTEKGIYRFWMDFQEKDVVTMYTDNLMYKEYNGVPQNSTYRFQQYQSPTLVFDTYSYLSIINDPNNGISGGDSNKGLWTDFEFRIISYEDGVFWMLGRINNVPASLTKATQAEFEQVQNGRLMNQLEAVSAFAAGKTMEYKVDGTIVSVIMKERSFTTVHMEGSNAEIDKSYTYLRMDNGDMIFVTPFTINGKTFTKVQWNEADQSYEKLVDEGGAFYPLEFVDKPSYDINQIFGLDKPFKRLRFYYDSDFIAQLGGSSNPVHGAMSGTSMLGAMLFGVAFSMVLIICIGTGTVLS